METRGIANLQLDMFLYVCRKHGLTDWKVYMYWQFICISNCML